MTKDEANRIILAAQNRAYEAKQEHDNAKVALNEVIRAVGMDAMGLSVGDVIVEPYRSKRYRVTGVKPRLGRPVPAAVRIKADGQIGTSEFPEYCDWTREEPKA
jgi:hypothetical protein